MRRLIFMTLASLAACAATPHDGMRVRQVDHIAPALAPAFVDCVADAWRARQPITSSVQIEQTRRANGSRVESRAGNVIFAAVDALDDGTTELRIGTGLFSPQRDYAACLTRYAGAS